MVYFAIGLTIGVVLGAGVALLVAGLHRRWGRAQARETFRALAAEALDANSQMLADRAGSTLEGKKALIDQAVHAVYERLEQVRKALQDTESQRREDFGKLGASVATLSRTAGELHQMLASSQRRGAWGERMAEDVLRLAGFQENVNYTQQSAEAAEQGRPDFTFFLPNDLTVNMDVKFPLETYKAYLDAETDGDRTAARDQLVRAVRGHIRAVARRGYVDTRGGTVPYVLVFVPSEQIFALVLAAEPDLLDEALGHRVVLTSPLTLYAMLAVIRQAAENVNLMRTADEVLALLGQFQDQWQRYNEELDKLGQRLESAKNQYDTLRATRTNMLQRPLDKIEELRASRGLPEGDGGDGE